MKKRLISMLLCVLMVISLVPTFVLPAAAAADVVKVEHNGTTTYYSSLQKAFDGFAPSNNTYGGKYVVTLLADNEGNLNKNLQYPTEVLDITLDLNGYTIKGDGTTIAVVINFGSKDPVKGSSFTIKDSSGNDSGKITGGKGGVKLDGKNCTLKFEGGTITGNHNASKGGGILMGATAKLVMTGGVITGNSVKGSSSANTGYGGGVLANYADILGGKIYGNTAYKGSHLQTGRGGGVCTEITRTAGYSTLTIADGVVYGNTAENAGDDVMAQGNGNVKFTLSIGTSNWFIDGWNGTKAMSGGGQTDRYNAESPVAYTDGGFTDVKNKTIGLKYVAPVAALPEAPDSNNDFSGREPIMFDCQDDIYAGVFFYYFVPEYATASEVYEEDGEYFVDITWNVKAFWESVKSWWDGSDGCGEHSLVDETVGYVVFTAKWNAESDKWEYEGDYIRYYITCASSVAPEAPDSYDDFANSPFTYRCEVKDENGNYPTVAANNFEKDYCASGDVYENNGEYFCDITWNMKKLWEEVDKPWFDSYVTYIHVGDHQPVEEFLEDKVFTAKWNGEKWEYVDEDAVYYVTCVTAPELPKDNGSNVTRELITIICDTVDGHRAITYGWGNPAANIVFPVGSTPVWDDTLGAWTIGVRIDSINTYYVNLRFSEEYDDIWHDVVGDGRIDTTLVWNAEDEIWETLTGEPFEVHVTCQDAPAAPAKGFLLSKFQIKVVGDINGAEKIFFSTLDYDSVTVGEVYGDRTNGFFVALTVTLENGDTYITNWIEKHASEFPAGTYVYDWNETEKTVVFTLAYTGNTTGELYDGAEYWSAYGDNVYTAYVVANAPVAPDTYGNNVTPDLIRVICDTDEDHAPINNKWQHQSTKIRDWVSGVVWSEEENAWVVPIRIDGISTYYVWLNFEKKYDNILHPLVPNAPLPEGTYHIDTYLKWDAEASLWVTLDEKPIEIHVACQTTPDLPAKLGSYQIQVYADLDGDGIFGESKNDCALGVAETYTTTIPAGGYTFGEVYGSRDEGFFVDVTVTLENGDAYITNFIENRAPGEDYEYDWDKTEKTVVFTLKYNRGTTGELYGEGPNDWVLATTGNIYGKVGEAYVKRSQPAAPKQANVTDKLVAIICDSDSDRHATVYGKWYPQHCKTTSEITWNAELGAWTVDIRIGSLYIMYVDQLEDANNNTTHELVEDITTVYATLVWDAEAKLWVPKEDIELHTTCRTVPLAPTYGKQIKSYQVKVWGELNGEEKAYTFYIPEDGYTIGEVYGSREEGFYVDITIKLEDGDFYQTSWIEKKNPGYFYTYDFDKTPTECTFTLRYNGNLNSTLYGDRHASNTNYDWVLDTNGKTFGVVVEAYLEQVKESVSVVIYRNGDTTTPYKTVSLGKIAKGETITLSDLDIADYYESANGFEFYGWYNDGAWNQYKAGKNPAATESITISGWTNIICMVYDYEEIVVKSVVDGNKDSAETLFTGTALYGTNLVEWLTANVTVADMNGYSFDKWYNWDDSKVADDALVEDSMTVYVSYTRNAYTITFNTDGGSEVAPITQNYGYTVSAPANPTKTGYTFAGWVRADGTAFSFDGYTMEAGDFTLTAKWTANKYTVLLIPNYGKINSGNVTEYTYGIGAKLPTNVTRPGYIFLGWFDNPALKGDAVAEIAATDIGDKVFYAKWEIDKSDIPTIRAYDVYVAHSVKGGSVSVNKTFVPVGVTVTITVEPESGYVLNGLTVTTIRGQDVKIRKVDETTYKFTMPASDVVVDAAFEYVVVDTTCKGDKNCPMYGFTDLVTDMWYHDGIHYCLENGLMNGYGNNIFAPEAETTRAMIVTILWRLEGSPKADYKMTFKDVKAGEWYTEAIRWAASEGIVLGYDEETFAPDDTITREQLATILYRYEKMNGGGFTGLWMFRLDYADAANVSDWAYEAMCWMTMNKIVQGKNDNVLDPQGGATRAEAATMLYRYCTKDEK